LFITTMNGDVPCFVFPMATHGIYSKGNIPIIAKTILIDISRTPYVMENVFFGADCSLEEIKIYTEFFKEFHDVFAWSYEEMSGIDPCIIEHEITTYLDVKLFRQKL